MAEKVIFGEITTGAGNDIERASELARKMVCEWGMSDELGPLAYGKKEEQIFLGREIAQHRDYSEDTARKIDEVVKNIILDATTATTTLLEENIEVLKAVADELLEKETITLEDIDRIIQEQKKPLIRHSIGLASPLWYKGRGGAGEMNCLLLQVGDSC